MKILIADHGGALEAAELSMVLAAGGHEVQVAQDGLQALRTARAWSPDLLLAPVHLPRMDGLALTAALRALGGGGAPAVVLLGPDGDHHTRSRGRALGVAAYLPLPLQPAALLQVVWRVERAALGPPAPQRRRGIPGARRRAG